MDVRVQNSSTTVFGNTVHTLNMVPNDLYVGVQPDKGAVVVGVPVKSGSRGGRNSASSPAARSIDAAQPSSNFNDRPNPSVRQPNSVDV